MLRRTFPFLHDCGAPLDSIPSIGASDEVPPTASGTETASPGTTPVAPDTETGVEVIVMMVDELDVEAGEPPEVDAESRSCSHQNTPLS